MKRINFILSDGDYQKLLDAQKKSGLQSQAELFRFLLTQYVKD